MQDIKNKIEEKIPHLLLSIGDSKESEIDEESCTEEYINIKRTLWEELSFIKQSSIKVKVENFDDFEFEQNEPFYDTEKKIIYYKDDTEVDEFSDILIDIFKVPKSLNGDFKYILTKKMSKIKIINEEVFNKINSLWIKIDDKTKENIIEALKKIGFSEDIKFQFHYTQNEFDSTKNKTEEEIQNEINKILEDEKFKIIFTFTQTKPLPKNDTENKNTDESESKNLVEDYNLDCEVPIEDNAELQKTNSSDLKTSTVNNFNEKKEKVEGNKAAKIRGLRIEVLLVQKLAKKYDSDKDTIKTMARKIFVKMQKEELENKIKRFDFKKEKKYDDILKEGNLNKILHISENLGDGVGFDILFPTIGENGKLKLLKVEVKSSEKGESIYLTENERKQILKYSKEEDEGKKKDKNFKIDFRIFIYKRDSTKRDITNLVFNILKQNNNFSNIKAETWILNINTKEKTK